MRRPSELRFELVSLGLGCFCNVTTRGVPVDSAKIDVGNSDRMAAVTMSEIVTNCFMEENVLDKGMCFQTDKASKKVRKKYGNAFP